jgi:transposase-like protein
MEYTETFRARMVRRMLGPKAVTASALSDEVGISQPTLSRWLRETATFRAMKEKDKPGVQPPPPPEAGKRAQDWTPKEKLRAVGETTSLEGEALGEYLRRHGLHREQLTQWHEIAISALEGPVSRRQAKAEGKRVKELERELRRKEKALAETAALLVLRKKANALWGGADDDTDEKNEP